MQSAFFSIDSHNLYIALQINTKEANAKPIVERYRQVWTPDLRILDADGFEYYRWNGYLPPFELLPPFEFLPQLLVAEAHARLRQENVSAAADLYNDVVERFPTSRVAAESAYYAAVANYRMSKDSADLLKGWENYAAATRTATGGLNKRWSKKRSETKRTTN